MVSTTEETTTEVLDTSKIEFSPGKICSIDKDTDVKLVCQGSVNPGPEDCKTSCLENPYCHAWSFNEGSRSCWHGPSGICIEPASGWVYGKLEGGIF